MQTYLPLRASRLQLLILYCCFWSAITGIVWLALPIAAELLLVSVVGALIARLARRALLCDADAIHGIYLGQGERAWLETTSCRRVVRLKRVCYLSPWLTIVEFNNDPELASRGRRGSIRRVVVCPDTLLRKHRKQLIRWLRFGGVWGGDQTFAAREAEAEVR